MRLLVMLLTSFLLVQPVRAGTPESGFSDTQYVGGLTDPTAVAFLPNGDLLITQKAGQLKLFNGSSTSTLVTIPVCTDSEMGLLGVALDPNFGTNGLIYLYRTKQGSSPPCGGSGRVNEVVSVTMTGGSVSLGSLVVLLTGMRTDNGNHDGGVLRMGPVDSKLYVGVGDTGLGDNVGGPGSSTNPYSQDLNELEGKVLRLNLDGTPPADNPFFGQVGKRGEIFAYGFRNPFRMSFDDVSGGTNDLWVGDVGDLTVEEIDIMASGGNYSWPRCEGNLQGPPGSPQPCVYGTDVAPIFTYPHSGGSSLGTCLIGGAFTGAAFGPLSGNYVFGDCTSSDVYLATVNGTRDGFTGTPSLASTAAGVPSDFVRGPDGAIYYVANGGGEVRRLAAALTGIDSPITGKVLNLKTASQNSVTAKSKDSAIDLGGGPGSSDDPTVSGGSVRIRSVSGGFDDTYPLPMGSSWSTIGDPSDAKGYRYKDPDQTNGPIKTVILRNGRLIKITGKGSGLNHTLTVNPDPVDVVLSTGTKRYCMSFGGTMRFTANLLFNAKDAPTGTCP